MSRVYFLACILMLISFTLSQCPPPSFPPLTVTANVVGAIPTDLYIDAENIYCPGSQAAQGGCETGYHDHTQFNVSASPTTISRNRVSTQTGPQGLLPLYVTHLSFRFYESQLVVDCPEIVYTDINQVAVFYNSDTQTCGNSKRSK